MRPPIFQLLTILLDHNLVARDLLDRLEDMGDADRPSLATFYRHLKNAIDEGWISVAGEEPSEGRGRPQQTYRITKSGVQAVTKEARRLRSMSDLALGRVRNR